MAESAGSGSVEQEARQLVEAAARWLAAVPDISEYAGRAADRAADADAAADRSAADPNDTDDRPDDTDASLDDTDADERSEAGRPGAEHLCHGCPWCRAKAAAGPLGADTLDSIAHLLSAAGESLSLFAKSRRDAAPAASEHDGEQDDEHGTDDDGTDDDGTDDDGTDDDGTDDDGTDDDGAARDDNPEGTGT